MRDSRSGQKQNVRQGGVFASQNDMPHALAPEIRAARMLLSPCAQEEIAQLAEDMESTLQGSQPARIVRSQHKRRGIALWVAVSLGGIIVLTLAGTSGWASAIKYHSMAAKNKLIANQEQQLASYFENQASTERKLRVDLQARDEQLKYIATSQLEIIADLSKKGHYAKAFSLIDLFTEITYALDDRGGNISDRLSQQRINTILAVITDVHGSETDLSGVRNELEKLSNIKNSSLNEE